MSQNAPAYPRRSMARYLIDAAKSLVTGLGITGRYLTHPKEVVTVEYPDNRPQLRFAERFRGPVTMPHDAEGEHRCTACGICEKACPNGTISILATRNLADKRVLGQFAYHLGQCSFCGLCVEVCPFDAIRMGHEFELASDQKADFERVLNHKEGR